MEDAKNLWNHNGRRIILALVLALIAALVYALLPDQGSKLPTAPSAELLEIAQGMDSVTITAQFLPDSRQLSVNQQLTLDNRGADARDELVLRTYANAFQSPATSPIATEELYEECYPHGFSAGSLVMASARVARGEGVSSPVDYRYLDDAKTVLTLPLDSPWQPGQQLCVELTYTLNIPRAAARFGENDGFWALGNAFALPAVYLDGAYLQDPYYPVGDPFVSECMDFIVRLSVPAGYTAAGSGWPTVTQNPDGGQTYAFTAPAVRDFALCLSQEYHLAQGREDNVLITLYAREPDQAQKALDYARRAMACYARLFGAYPYPSLTLAQVEFPFGGMEYPALIMLSGEGMQAGGQQLEWVVAHEVAHQWWYAVVGSDQVNQAWQDEALAEYSVLEYVEQYYGKDDQERLRRARIDTAMHTTVPNAVTPGSPLSYFADMAEYALVVYGRGAYFLCDLDAALGGTLDDFLKAYYDSYQFQLASRVDFEALLQVYSGQDWGPLMVDYLDTLMPR